MPDKFEDILQTLLVALDFCQKEESSELASSAADSIPIADKLNQVMKLWRGLDESRSMRKLIRFVESVKKSSSDEHRFVEIDSYFDGDEDRRQFGAELLEALQRFDDERKADIVGSAAVGIIKGEITRKEFWRIAKALHNLSLDEELPIIYILERYKAEFYTRGKADDQSWNHEGVFLSMVQAHYSPEMTDGQLRSVMWGITATGLFGPDGWREGPAHDCEFAPLYFKLKPHIPVIQFRS